MTYTMYTNNTKFDVSSIVEAEMLVDRYRQLYNHTPYVDSRGESLSKEERDFVFASLNFGSLDEFYLIDNHGVSSAEIVYHGTGGEASASCRFTIRIYGKSKETPLHFSSFSIGKALSTERHQTIGDIEQWLSENTNRELKWDIISFVAQWMEKV